jgi:hypothetical protein
MNSKGPRANGGNNSSANDLMQLWAAHLERVRDVTASILELSLSCYDSYYRFWSLPAGQSGTGSSGGGGGSTTPATAGSTPPTAAPGGSTPPPAAPATGGSTPPPAAAARRR